MTPSVLSSTAGGRLLSRLRIGAGVLAVTSVLVTGAVVAASGADTPVRVAAAVGALVVAGLWTARLQGGRLPAPLAGAEVLALALLVVAQHGTLALPLGLIFLSLFGSRRTTLARAVPALALLVVVHLPEGLPPSGQVLGLVLGAALADALREATSTSARNERLLQAIVDRSADVTCIVGRDLVVRWVSSPGDVVLGVTRDEILGRRIDELVHDADAEAAAAALGELAASPGATRVQPLRLRDHAEGARWVEVEVTNELADAELGGFLIHVRDQTEQRRLAAERTSLEELRQRIEADRERQELEARLQRSERLGSVGQLAGGIAHDFNNLLGIILNYAAFIRSALPGDHAVREDLAEIESAAARGAKLTRQLLVFSQRSATRPERLDVNHLLHGLERLLDVSVGQRIELRRDLAPAVSAVEIDPANLEQIVVNLVVNARDAIGGTGVIELVTENVKLDAAQAAELEVVPGDYVTLGVRDDGPGMDAATRARAVEPFFTTKPVGEGTGLGLATAYGVAQAAGGTLHIDSEPGHGACIRVVLPAVGPPAATSEPEPAAHGDAGPRAEILLVEDEPSVRALVERILRGAGHGVHVAASGAEALALAAVAERPHDLVVTDVVMPGMTGLELTKRLRARHPGQAVLLMSGYSDDLLAAERPDRVLAKPFTADELLAAVREVLDEHTTVVGG